MSVDTTFSFRNIEGDTIHSIFSPSQELMKLEITSQENGILDLKTTHFRFSRAPDHKEDTTVKLLFRDFLLLKKESDNNNCSSFKLFTKTEEDSGQNVKVTILKFGYDKDGQARAQISSLGFGIMGGVGIAITGTGLVAGSALLVAGAATGALFGMAITAGQHALSSEIDYNHQQCKDETLHAGMTGAFTSGLAAFLGPFIGNLPWVGQTANSVVSKVPVKANTVVKVIVAGGLGATFGTVDAINDWYNGKSFKLDKLVIKSLSSMVGASISNGLLRGVKVLNAQHGHVRPSFGIILDKAASHGIGGGVRQMTENLMEGTPVEAGFYSAALFGGGMAFVGGAAKEIGKFNKSTLSTAPSSPTTPKPKSVNVKTGNELMQEGSKLIERHFSPKLNELENKKWEWLDINGKWYKYGDEHKSAIIERLGKGRDVTFRDNEKNTHIKLNSKHSLNPHDKEYNAFIKKGNIFNPCWIDVHASMLPEPKAFTPPTKQTKPPTKQALIIPQYQAVDPVEPSNGLPVTLPVDAKESEKPGKLLNNAYEAQPETKAYVPLVSSAENTTAGQSDDILNLNDSSHFNALETLILNESKSVSMEKLRDKESIRQQQEKASSLQNLEKEKQNINKSFSEKTALIQSLESKIATSRSGLLKKKYIADKEKAQKEYQDLFQNWLEVANKIDTVFK